MKLYLRWSDKNGERYWFAEQSIKTLSEDGKPIRRSKWIALGVKGKNKRKAAERALRDLEMELRTKNRQITSAPTVAQFMEQYLSTVRLSVKEKTLRSYRMWLGQFAGFFGLVRVSEITQIHVESFKTHIAAHYSATSVNIGIRSLKAAMNYAVRVGFIDRSPLAGVKMAQVAKRTFPPFITMEQFKTVVLPSVENPRSRVILCLAMLAGLRRREIAYLRWDQIDFERSEIRIESNEAFQTKSGHGRVVPLYATLRTELEKLPRKSAYVLSVNEAAPDDSAIGRIWTRVKRNLVAAGHPIPDIPFHGLRHSFATWLANDVGLNLKALQAILGHSDIQTTMLYAHLQPQMAVEMAKKVDV